ncbi:MAG: endonuclease/exonuclease/phosphatase family protein [Anaerolineae bacterium]
MKVLAYNIRGWQTPAGQPNIELLAEVIAESQADLVGLNEVFHPAPTAEGPALAVLARRLGMQFAFGPTVAAAPQPGHLPYGNAFLSRWPIQAFAAHHLAPMTAYGKRGLLEVRVRVPQMQSFTVYVTHLDHRSEALRLEQWAAAYTWLSRDCDRPHLVIGDFNALSASDYPTADALAQLAAYQAARGWPTPSFDLIAQVLKAGYLDAHTCCGGGAAPTYPAQAPERRIDYIFLPRTWASALVGSGRIISPAAQAASDHLPVYAEFVL